MDWFSLLFFSLFHNMFGLIAIASPIVAISTLAVVVYGLVKHRSWSNLWWIVPSAVISLTAFMIAGYMLYSVLTYAFGGGGA